jgi:hypothetical protein
VGIVRLFRIETYVSLKAWRAIKITRKNLSLLPVNWEICLTLLKEMPHLRDLSSTIYSSDLTKKGKQHAVISRGMAVTL